MIWIILKLEQDILMLNIVSKVTLFPFSLLELESTVNLVLVRTVKNNYFSLCTN